MDEIVVNDSLVNKLVNNFIKEKENQELDDLLDTLYGIVSNYNDIIPKLEKHINGINGIERFNDIRESTIIEHAKFVEHKKIIEKITLDICLMI